MKSDKIKIGITQGDINGVSYEVIIKSLMDNRIFNSCTILVYGSPKVAAYHRKVLNLDNFSFNSIKSATEANDKRPNIVNCLDDDIRVELGKSTDIAGKASIKCLEDAVRDLKDGKIDVLVTAPVDKHNIQSDQFRFPGHTEYLESVFESEQGSLMLMVSESFRIGVVTGHVSFSEIHDLITEDRILNKLRILDQSLKVDFGIRRPNIAVLGLNPHAGDLGLIGKEEQEVISPAIDKARDEGIMALGPFPADGFFGALSQQKFDGVLAMYHDQGLIPFKTLAFQDGVNYTAGLSIVRTAPVHGTAYDITGKDQACFGSIRNALYLAVDIYKKRQLNDELTAHPLAHHDVNNDA